MSYPINYPTPQGANVQIFKEGGTTSDWVKPQGASFVWFTLIGAGGVDGGSAAVTNFMGPAFLMPNVLRVTVGAATTTNGNASTVIYQQKSTTGYTLLTADGGLSASNGGTGGVAMTANSFTASGFFQSVAGATAIDFGGSQPSTTTFLSAMAASGSNPTANYGYSTTPTGGGYSQISPIIVSVAGGRSGSQKGGFGSAGSPAGDGLVVIITW